MANTWKNGVAAVLVGLLFVGAGGYAILTHSQDLDRAEPIDAVVLSSGVERDVTHDSDGMDDVTYSPEVTYRYTYEGREYTSESVFPGIGDHSTSETRAHEIADRYAEGKRVTAHFVPEEPGVAFLIPEGVPVWYYLLPLLGALAVVFGLGTVVKDLLGVDLPVVG